MNIAKVVIAVILFVLVFILFIQNTEVIPFKLFLWEFSMSRIVLLMLSMMIGLIIGYILGTVKIKKQGSEKKI